MYLMIILRNKLVYLDAFLLLIIIYSIIQQREKKYLGYLGAYMFMLRRVHTSAYLCIKQG